MLIRVRGRKRDITSGYKTANKMRLLCGFFIVYNRTNNKDKDSDRGGTMSNFILVKDV